jgi:hypothetical protein
MKRRVWKRHATRYVRTCLKVIRYRRDWHWRWGADIEPLLVSGDATIAALRTRQGRADFIECAIYDGFLPEMPGRPQDREAMKALVYGAPT